MSAYLKVYFPSTKQRRNNTALASYRFPGEGGWGERGGHLFEAACLLTFLGLQDGSLFKVGRLE